MVDLSLSTTLEWTLASILLLLGLAAASRRRWLASIPDLLLRCATLLVSQAWLLWRRLARAKEGHKAHHPDFFGGPPPGAVASKGPTFVRLEAVLHKKRRHFPWTWGPLLVSLDNADLLYFHGPERSSRLKRRIPLQSCTVKGPSSSGPERAVFRLCLPDK